MINRLMINLKPANPNKFTVHFEWTNSYPLEMDHYRSLCQVRYENPVDEKPGQALYGQWKVVNAAGKRDGLLYSFRICGFACHDFNERHLCNRIEKMKSDQPFRSGQSRGKFFNRNA